MMNNSNSMMPMTTLKRQNSTVEEEAETLEADAMNILIGLNKSPPTSLDFVDCNSKAAVAQPTLNDSSSIDQPSSSNNVGQQQDDDANHHQIVDDDGQRSLRPRTRKPSARAAEAALMADSYTSLDIGSQPSRTRGRATSKDSSIVSTSSSSTAAGAAGVGGNSNSEAAEIAKKKKPMRPLTAYHIFFQLEREYIIQTTDVDNDDMKPSPSSSSIQDTNTSTTTKYYHKNVPPKYRNILLSSDWYYGPGKRQKRKHRKSHGKIGFLELSKVISKQWSTLEQNDNETKLFVNDIAKQELDEYKLDIMKWKEMYGDVLENVDDKKKKGKKKVGGGSRKSSSKKKRAVKISDNMKSDDKG